MDNRHERVRWGRVLGTLAVMALIVGGAAAVAVGLARSRKKAPRTKPVAARTGVRTVALEVRRITPEVEGLGRARPRRTVAVAVEVGGRVLEVAPRLESGERVEAGMLAVRIDPADLASDAARLAAARDAAQAEAARLEAQTLHLAARLGHAERLLELERADVARAERLLGQGVGTDRAVELSRLAVVRAQDGLAAVRMSTAELAPAQLAAAARSREAEARLARAERDLARAEIRIPFTGQLAAVAVEAHQLLTPGQTLFELREVDTMEVPVALSVDDALLLAPTLEATPEGSAAAEAVVVQEGNGIARRWRGRVVRFEPVDPATQTVRAVVQVDTEEGQVALAPGVFCRVGITASRAVQGLALPLAALQERDQVFLARDGRLAIVTARIAMRIGSWAIVEDGLTEGDRVIVSPLERVIEGLPLDEIGADGSVLSVVTAGDTPTEGEGLGEGPP